MHKSKNNCLKIILKSNFSWRCFLSLLLFSFCQFYCIFFCPVYSKPTGKKTAKHANHMTLRLGGFLIRRTYVGSEAMPTFKLPHYRWEKHIAIWICYMPFINDCVCQVVSAGICLVALAVTRLSEMKLTEHLAVSQSDGGGDGSQSEWHLSWCTSGFSSEPPARATRGFHWSYMLQGRPFSVRSKGWGSESTPLASGDLLNSLHLTQFQPW